MSQSHHAPPPQQMFQMITGLWVSQLCGALAELRIIDAFGGAPLTPAEVAQKTKCDPRAIERVLRAAATVGIVTQSEGRYQPTPLGDTLRDAPGSMRNMAIAQTSSGHWLPWGRFPDAVRSGTRQTLAAYGSEIFDYYAKTPREAAAFSGAMQGLSTMVASEVGRVLDTTGASRVVDVGGATGTLLSAVLTKNTSLKGLVLDLPHVVDHARAALDQAGVGPRCEVVAGDFFKNVPGADLYLLKQILHDWSDDECVAILTNCRKNMEKNGRVAIIEMVIPDDLSPSPAQLMDLNMMVLLKGRERTRAEYTQLFERAGLRFVKLTETHSPFQIIEAAAA